MQKMDAVGRLAGGITHDINNYLAAIATNCELVQMRAEPGGPVAAKMETVLGVVSKASSLIDRLLAFSRQQPVEAQVVNLNRLIDDPEKMIVRSIGEDTRLESRLEPDLWNTEIDPAQLEQVVLNLLVNARQAMPSGGVVTIETANIELAESYGANDALVRAGEYVMLAVSDDGPGIPAENLDRIFEPFFTTKDRSSNNGLGLATIYGIVNQNGGHVRVQSELGQGATFKIYLPRVQAEESAQAEAWRAPVETAEGTECILLVEDNDDFRRSAEALLEGLGYRVIAAASGKGSAGSIRSPRRRYRPTPHGRRDARDEWEGIAREDPCVFRGATRDLHVGQHRECHPPQRSRRGQDQPAPQAILGRPLAQEDPGRSYEPSRLRPASSDRVTQQIQ